MNWYRISHADEISSAELCFRNPGPANCGLRVLWNEQLWEEMKTLQVDSERSNQFCPGCFSH